ncbi:MAG: hypothetical protein NZ482_01950 [Gloeomargarita sp. SKYG98]|nr:hypothetical protein [Gloeomargarita sp. SKYG98]
MLKIQVKAETALAANRQLVCWGYDTPFENGQPVGPFDKQGIYPLSGRPSFNESLVVYWAWHNPHLVQNAPTPVAIALAYPELYKQTHLVKPENTPVTRLNHLLNCLFQQVLPLDCAAQLLEIQAQLLESTAPPPPQTRQYLHQILNPLPFQVAFPKILIGPIDCSLLLRTKVQV